MTVLKNFFNKLFGKNSARNATAQASAEPVDVNAPPYELFVNPKPPVPAMPEAPALKHPVYLHPVLQTFIDRDFFQSGYNDGYRYRTAEVKDNTLRRIGAEFRNLLRDCIQEERDNLQKLEGELILYRGLHAPSEEKILAAVAEARARVELMSRELELTVEGEGLIAVCLHDYTDGFLRGAMQRLDEILIARGTNLALRNETLLTEKNQQSL
ncbi:MAG: hypothetical protein IPM52_03475 [Bacteroidetes bacterium]|nr:hypothetical protein [Bacteroidota bacterium]